MGIEKNIVGTLLFAVLIFGTTEIAEKSKKHTKKYLNLYKFVLNIGKKYRLGHFHFKILQIGWNYHDISAQISY